MIIDWGAVSIIAIVLKTIFDILKERGKPRLDKAQSSELEERIRKSLEASMLAENTRLTARVETLTADLSKSNAFIIELQERDRKREAAMIALQADFDRDTALRVNIDKMLAVANQRITALETERTELYQRISALEDELDKRDALIKELESNQRQVGSGGLLSR